MLVSGSGTNLQALIDGSGQGWDIVAVISDRPNVRALERATAADIATEVVAWSDFADRAEFTDAVVAAVQRHEADFAVLAGFMRVLAPAAIAAYPNRIINVHPSLLPAFPGANAVGDAIEHGVKVTGVTVHFVDEELDHGPIIRQEVVEILPDDDEATLHRRIQRVEHRLLPEVVSDLATGRLAVAGRHVRGRVDQ